MTARAASSYRGARRDDVRADKEAGGIRYWRITHSPWKGGGPGKGWVTGAARQGGGGGWPRPDWYRRIFRRRSK